MHNEYVKASAIPYVGYRYQSLYGVQVLVDWLEAPAAFARMRFECDDQSIGPQGLDDIVMERADGLVDYRQVKYTPPGAASGCILTWDWLLEPATRGAKSKSFIQKWAQALSRIPPERLGTAALITNRTPDRGIEASLDGDHLSFDRAPSEAQGTLQLQLGSAAVARTFLKTLKVLHSEHSFNDLDRVIQTRLAGMGFHSGGIARLLAKAPDWASLKDEPPPDGWITLDVVRGELSLAQPAPVPQDFDVPEGYEPPDQGFHENLLEEIRKSSGGLVTLVGPPGRGKSTYLSYLCERLTELRVPVIRHHYFLSLSDRSGDRLSPARIARSLLSQVRLVAGSRLKGDVNVDKAEELTSVLTKCGQAFASERIPFVVVVDGLDHVWRDNRGDVRPLDELFRQLLPLPANVLLLVGTQPVDDERLPERLLADAPRRDWRELPPMTGDAVHGYVMRQVQAGRWQTRSRLEHAELAKCSAALHERTHGHPLHVIYSVEELLGRTLQPSEYDIHALPDCPGDDIRVYYRALWTNLKYHQRDVLHLMSALAFRWPAQAFDEMSAVQDPGRLSLDGVRHLLFDTGLGLQPFHESLVVFIKEDGDHEASVARLLPRAEEWLRTRAPARLRNTWHWLVLADLRNSRPLREGLTRDWLLDRLIEGYPVNALVRMLTRAEEIAFAERAFGEAYRHRMLKTRLLNGPEYQVENPSRLLRASWALSPDASLSQDAFVTRQQMGTHVLPWLVLALQERGDGARAREGCRYAIKRWNSELRLSARRADKECVLERLTLGDAVLQSGIAQGPEGLAKEMAQAPNWGRAKLVSYLLKRGDLSLVVDIWREIGAGGKRQMLEDAACQLAALAGVDITSWEEFGDFTASAFAAVVAHLKGLPFSSVPSTPLRTNFEGSIDLDVRRYALRNMVRDWFLRSLAVALYAQGDFEWLPAPTFEHRQNLVEYLDMLQSFAAEVSEALTAGMIVPFEAVFEYFKALEEPMNIDFHQREAYNDFRRGLLQVALDCHLISTVFGGPRAVEVTSWRSAKTSPWLHTYVFPEFALEQGMRVFSPGIIQEVLDDGGVRAVRELQETCTIAQELLELCELALLYGEADRARGMLRQAWDITIGYGHRKDPALSDVLWALKYLAEVDAATARKLLSSVAPQVASVTSFTDGSGTRHIPGGASALLAKLDRHALAKQYDEQIKNGEWYDAETSMKHLLASANTATVELHLLAKTGLAIKERGVDPGKGGPLGPVAAMAMEHQGAVPSKPESSSNALPDKAAEDKVDITAYPPSAFDKLLTDLGARRGIYDETLSDWFHYWKAKDKSSTLLRYVRPVVLSVTRRQLLFNRILDDLFETSAELERKSDGTFEIAVKAQTENGGWSHFFEQAETTEGRLSKVAELFPNRADEFIARSAVNWLTTEGSPSELMIPGDKLVFFLIRLGRIDEAIELAKSIADCVIADTSGLVLPLPAWA